MKMGHGLGHLHAYRYLDEITHVNAILVSFAQHVVQATKRSTKRSKVRGSTSAKAVSAKKPPFA
jgi:hypothetical protein